MKNGESPKKKRQWLESALLAGGALLLAIFVVARSWSSLESRSGVEAFEQARAAMNSAAVTETVVMPDAEPEQWLAIPDTTLWSEKRIREHQASLQAPADAPRAILDIGHLGIRVPVYNGADEFNLNRGVARIIGTGRVGEGGNLGIAGHRDGFFRPLKDIEIGDTLALETYAGTETYRVASIDIVDATELSVLAPTDTPTVTLVTCYPFYFVGNAPQRFIVKAEVVENQVNS